MRPRDVTGAHADVLEPVIAQLAELAAAALRQSCGVGVSLFSDDAGEAVSSTSQLIRELDTLQINLHQGPCLTSSFGHNVVYCDDLGSDDRWPDFGVAAAERDVNSSMSVPMPGVLGLSGSINFYAHEQRAFGVRDVRQGEVFALSAAIALEIAHGEEEVDTSKTLFAEVFSRRSVVEQATGILRSRGGGEAADAWDRMRRIGQNQQRTLYEIAQDIVGSAVTRVETSQLKDPSST